MIHHLSRLSILAVLGTLCAMPAQADKILAQTTFDTDLGGWTCSEPAALSWSAGGGNPGGRAVFSETGGTQATMIAPASFLAGAINYSKLNGKAYISWQHQVVQEIDVRDNYPYQITISGPGGSAIFTASRPTTFNIGPWRQLVAPLVEADWTVTNGSWIGILTDVESIHISIEQFVNGNIHEDVEAMDNIKVVSHPKGFSPK